MILGIDLGTDTIKICSKNHKITIIEKNMIAIRSHIHVKAIGDLAYEMYEKTPVNVDAGCPMSHGVIADARNMEIVIAGLLKKCTSILSIRPTIYIAVPKDISGVEKRAYFNVWNGKIKAKRIHLVDKGIADAIGAGISVKTSTGHMVVNIGADTTELSVLTDGKILIGKVLKIGGKKLDEDIATMVRRMFQLNIGMKTAEKLKNTLAYVLDGPENSMEASGISTVSGLPKKVSIPALSVCVSIMESIDFMISNIKSTLDRIPPQYLEDIRKNGICLTGGVSGILNLAEYMRKELDINIYIVRDPVMTTVNGLVEIINEKEYADCTYSLKDLAGNTI